MGTNFYVRIPLKPREKKELKNILNNKLYKAITEGYFEDEDEVKSPTSLFYEIEEQYIKPKLVHLGKRSYGWSFFWDLNDMKYFEPTLQSIKKFIDDNNGIIEDEYGDKFSWNKFISDEIGPAMYTNPEPGSNPYNKDSCYLSHRLYAKRGGSSYNYYPEIDSKLIDQVTPFAKDGFVDTQYGEFHTKAGLRFSLYTDFS